MFNVTVLRIKDLQKYLILIMCIFLGIYLCKNWFLNLGQKEILKSEIEIVNSEKLVKVLEQEFTVLGSFNDSKIYEDKEEVSEYFNLESTFTLIGMVNDTEILKPEALDGLEIKGENSIGEIKKVEPNDTKNVSTEVITKNPISDGCNVTYGNVKIKNESGYELTEDILNPNITLENKNIFVFHTHTCESYTPSEKYTYTQSGNYRTTDLGQSVARLGEELKNNMSNFGISVFHNQDYHDYPSYNGSYTRSLATIKKELNNNPCDIVIDIHRDAIGSLSDYAPTVKIGEEEAAQIMFVIGTNAGGLEHPNWQQNLKFAVKVQQKAEEMYPGLFKTMLVTYSRYNQHTAKHANIMEVGATGNTLDQTIVSMKYLANVMNEVLK